MLRTTGEGTLFPALVIGLGQMGAEVLHTLREGLDARFGSMNDVPHIRLLYIDTDGDAVSAAARAAAGPLSVTETLPVRVNRPSHYLRATGGKTMLEGGDVPPDAGPVPGMDAGVESDAGMDADPIPEPTPELDPRWEQVPNISDALSVSVGEDGHNCALRGTGEVACWGKGAYGQLGDGTLNDTVTP